MIVKKKIEIKSKDSKGDPNLYELSITLKIEVYNETSGKILKKEFNRKLNYKNQDDKFQLNQYQKEIEKLLIGKIIEDILSYLSNL